MNSTQKKNTIFAPAKSQRAFFIAELLQPYYGTHPQHFFPELETFPIAVLGN